MRPSAASLSKPAILEQQVRRMLADPRATSALVDDFAAQWLNLRRVGEVVVHPDFYPDFDDNLLDAFKQETELFIASTLREDRSVARSAARRLHVRQRTARAPLRDSRRLRQPLPSRHAAQSRSTRRAARAGRHSRDHVVSGSNLAGAARQVAARQHLRHLRAAAAAERRHEPDRGEAGHGAADDPRAARAAPAQSGLRQLPRRDRSAGLCARELRRHRRVADRSTKSGKPVDAVGTTVSGAPVDGSRRPARAAAAAARAVSDDGHREAAGVCARPAARVLRSAGRAPDCPGGRRRGLSLVVAHSRNREESDVPDAGHPA